ncbi:MAG: exodeoxyribonuclease VII large subunit [Butyrivibrio sp.]|nr:exodeoxyribonuclease VII large subunit [Butyrivibrio sp.]
MAKIYSVEQINNYIKQMFNTDFVLSQVSVQGEISNCKYHSSGHIYFTIKDNGSVLNAIMFAGNRTGLKFQMKDGMQVVVSGNISVYERDGKYQMYAKRIEQTGMGDLYQRFLELKKELEEMGMFDALYKKPIPKYAAKIGIVTASTGAAIQDIINISTRRNPYVQLVLYPAIVQGEFAVDSICRGINKLEEYGVDTIIVGRGGGSIEDLWAFNDVKVANAIFECSIPVISAVGHETDFTIADFVADMRAPTPSAAAELAVCNIFEILESLADCQSKLNTAMRNRIDFSRMTIQQYQKVITNLSPINMINTRRQYLEQLSMQLNHNMENLLTQRRNYLKTICASLDSLSPLARLCSGYSYVRDIKGKTLNSVENINAGDRLRISVTDGDIWTKVETVSGIKRS